MTPEQQFAADVMERINAALPATSEPVLQAELVIQEPTWFEDAENRLLDDISPPNVTMLLDSDNMTAMQTKEACRRMLAATAYREIGWPALALFDRMLVVFGTGKDWLQCSGWANVPPEDGSGLVPSLTVCNAAQWAAIWLQAKKAGDVEAGAKALCKLAYLMTVMFFALPPQGLRESDQPSAEQLEA